MRRERMLVHVLLLLVAFPGGSGNPCAVSAELFPAPALRDSSYSKLTLFQKDGATLASRDGRLVWIGREPASPGMANCWSKERSDSLALIASWCCPGNTDTGGQLQAWDLDANGIPDLSYCAYRVGGWPPDSTYIVEATADNEFRVKRTFPSPYVPFWTGLLCAGDGDSDGLAEMVFGSQTAGIPRDLVFLEARKPGAYPDSVVLVLPESNISVSHMRRGDLDGDGRWEYIGTTQAGGSEAIFAIWENRGDNAFEQVFSWGSPLGGCSGEIAIGDFDGDGRGEAVFPIISDVVGLQAIESTGDDCYEPTWFQEVPTDNLFWVTPGPDLDRDGRGDFVATGGRGWGGDVWWSFLMYESTGNDSYELVWSYQVHSGMIDGGSATGDIDGDGWPELLCQVPDRTMLFRAVGDNQLELIWEHEGPVNGQGGHRVIAPDLDGDSKGEAIWWLSSDPGCLVAYEWAGDPASASDTPPPSRTRLVFPNPFGVGDRMNVDLDRESWVSVEVVDILGRRVAILAEGTRAAGVSPIEWRYGPSCSGVYFCRLRTDRSTEIRKIVTSR